MSLITVNKLHFSKTQLTYPLCCIKNDSLVVYSQNFSRIQSDKKSFYIIILCLTIITHFTNAECRVSR